MLGVAEDVARAIGDGRAWRLLCFLLQFFLLPYTCIFFTVRAVVRNPTGRSLAMSVHEIIVEAGLLNYISSQSVQLSPVAFTSAMHEVATPC